MLKVGTRMGDRSFKIASAPAKPREKRILRAALGAGEGPDHTGYMQKLEQFFKGLSPDERKSRDCSILSSVLAVGLAFFIVWPTVQGAVFIKEKPRIYTPVPGGARTPAPRKREQRQRPRIKEMLIPQLYPDIKEVENIIEDEQLLRDEDDWASLDVDGSISGLDTGIGTGGYGGPVLNAGEGGDVPYPEIIREVKPDYPDAARRARVDGFVLLEGIVSTEGKVVDIKVLQSPPARYGFAEKAIEAVQKWLFKPSIYKGKAVNVRILIQVDFTLLY